MTYIPPLLFNVPKVFHSIIDYANLNYGLIPQVPIYDMGFVRNDKVSEFEVYI